MGWATGAWAAGAWAGTAWAESGAPPVVEPPITIPYTPPNPGVPGIISPSLHARALILKDDAEFLDLFEAMAESGLFDSMRDEH